jgi:hypothetical protein
MLDHKISMKSSKIEEMAQQGPLERSAPGTGHIASVQLSALIPHFSEKIIWTKEYRWIESYKKYCITAIISDLKRCKVIVVIIHTIHNKIITYHESDWLIVSNGKIISEYIDVGLAGLFHSSYMNINNGTMYKYASSIIFDINVILKPNYEIRRMVDQPFFIRFRPTAKHICKPNICFHGICGELIIKNWEEFWISGDYNFRLSFNCLGQNGLNLCISFIPHKFLPETLYFNDLYGKWNICESILAELYLYVYKHAGAFYREMFYKNIINVLKMIPKVLIMLALEYLL